MQSSAYRPFKVIQARWFWHQSKARMGLPISLSSVILHSNLGPVLHHFWYTATYWLKIANFNILPSCITPLRMFHFDSKFAVKFTTKKLESWDYSPVKTAWSYESFWYSTSVWQTDRRTDGFTFYHSIVSTAPCWRAVNIIIWLNTSVQSRPKWLMKQKFYCSNNHVREQVWVIKVRTLVQTTLKAADYLLWITD